MATKKNTAAEATETTDSAAKTVSTSSKTAAKVETTYTADEFAKAAGKLFGKKYNADIVRAAFKVAKKTTATKAEATEIVKAFAERKVK